MGLGRQAVLQQGDGSGVSIGKDHLKGSAIRQDLLETAIKWASDGAIEDHMARHQHDASAKPLWEHFLRVIEWVESCFETRPNLMRGQDWGALYDKHRSQPVDFEATEAEIQRLIDDDDVQRHRGIYAYIFTRDEHHLGIRAFSPAMKRRAYERQEGCCPSAAMTLRWRRWRRTISHHGPMAERRSRKTAKCCAGTTRWMDRSPRLDRSRALPLRIR